MKTYAIFGINMVTGKDFSALVLAKDRLSIQEIFSFTNLSHVEIQEAITSLPIVIYSNMPLIRK